MENLSIIGSICSIISLLIAVFLAERVIKIKNNINQINSKIEVKQTQGDDKSIKSDMKKVRAKDIVFGYKSNAKK